jgi:hypothetical protein
MLRASWQAASDGRYWIDVTIAGRELRVMIDLGLVDPSGLVGFELEPAVYNGMKRADRLTRFSFRFRRDASGQVTSTESGFTTAQLFNPVAAQPIGPVVHTGVCRGEPGIPNRVGVAFFQRLVGAKVLWDLDTRTWQIECG